MMSPSIRVALALALTVIATALTAPGAVAAGITFDTPKDTRVVDGTSVGGARLGHKRARVVKKLGKPTSTVRGETKSFFCDTYAKIGLAVCFKRIKGKVTSAVPSSGKAKTKVKNWNGTVITFGIANPAFRTVDGSLGIGTDFETLTNWRKGTELNWGPDKFGNPPDARAYEVADSDDPGITRWFLTGTGEAGSPITVASFIIGIPKYMGSLSGYLDSQSPKPE
ncbi:MAG: hypothetical protein JHC98_06525 [Thermoleophilaceae bacterium]|nr:hypothetical protein [Thermoleophilaceae bacterium]